MAVPSSLWSRALRGPALRTAGYASFARRCARRPSPVARTLVAASVGVAFCPLRAGRLRGSGFASFAATPPPSSTPLGWLGRRGRRSLPSLDASPPSLRVGRLRWPAPCGPGVLRKKRRHPCPRKRHPARHPALLPRGLPGRAWLPGSFEGPSGRAHTPRAATWVRHRRGGQLQSGLATAQTACAGQDLKNFIPPSPPLGGQRSRPVSRWLRPPCCAAVGFAGPVTPGRSVPGITGRLPWPPVSPALAPGQANGPALPSQAVHGKPSRLLPWLRVLRFSLPAFCRRDWP